MIHTHTHPPESSAPQPGHLLPGCLPKREVSLCSRRGELRTPPPAWQSQFGSLPPRWLSLLAEEASFPSPRVLMHGATLLSEKEAWPACGASPNPAAHHHAQLSGGAPLETSGRESEHFAGLTGYMEKFGRSFWCARLGGASCTYRPQPHRHPIGQTQCEMHSGQTQHCQGWNYVYAHTQTVTFLSSCPEKAE